MTAFALVLPFDSPNVIDVNERREANAWMDQWSDQSRRENGLGPWSVSLWLFGEQPWLWQIHDHDRSRRRWWPCPAPPPSWLIKYMVMVHEVRGPSDVAEPERWHGRAAF